MRKFAKFFITSLVFLFGVTYTVAPEEIKNLQINQNDNDLVLTWDKGVSEEDVIVNYKIYYGTKSVETVDDFYDNEIEIPSLEKTYTFSNLEFEVPYFFAITALDSQGNESGTYSKEASFTLTDTDPIEIIEEDLPAEVVEENIEEEILEVPEFQEEEIREEIMIEELPPEENMDFKFLEELEAEIIEDITPPVDASNFQVDSSRIKSDRVAILSWSPSPNFNNDFADQILYIKKGQKDWDNGYSIGTEVSYLEIDVEVEQNYEIKLVSADFSGNESEGVYIVFSTNLNKSGPVAWISLAIGLFCLLFLMINKRKQV